MENNKLKPCPFCGSENVKIFEYRGTSKFYVICKNCFTPVGIYDGKDEATKRWNTRAWIPPDDYADAKIGDIVECDGIKLKVVDASDYKYSDCGKNCYFDGDQRCALVCCNDREDGVPVFFQKEDDK